MRSRRSLKVMLVVLPFALSLAGLASPLQAATVNVSWNPNQETSLAGYIVSYGTTPRAQQSYSQTVTINDKNSTSWSTDLPAGTYYFALKAFDTLGQQSDYSTEVSVVVSQALPPGKPGRPVLVQ